MVKIPRKNFHCVVYGNEKKKTKIMEFAIDKTMRTKNKKFFKLEIFVKICVFLTFIQKQTTSVNKQPKSTKRKASLRCILNTMN